MTPTMMIGVLVFLGGLVIILVLIFGIGRLDHDKRAVEADSARRRRNLEGLLTISEATLRSDSLENVYQHTLDVVLEQVGYSDASIVLLNEDETQYYAVAHRNWTPEMAEELSVMNREQFPTNVLEAIVTREPDFTDDMSKDPARYPRSPVAEGYRANIIVPLLAIDQAIGVIVIDVDEVHEWMSEEVRWLAAIGRNLGIIVEHIRVSEQMQEMAVLKERERLSQELHDNLSQIISTLRVRAESTQLFLKEGDLDNVRIGLERIENISQEAYVSVRNEMLGLRDTIDEGHVLIPVLNKCIGRFQRQWGLEAALDQGNVAEDMFVPPGFAIQLLRIIQEALSNTGRHSQATRVVVRLKTVDHRLQVQIEDNGCGFDPDQVTDDRLGLRIMRDRVISLGGDLKIFARPSAGTRLLIEAPLYRKLETQK